VSPRAAAVEDEPRRHGVIGALAAALPDRSGGRHDGTGPGLRVVEPAARRRRTWQVGTVAGGLLFLAMFVIVGAQTLIVQQQQHIDDVNNKIAAAESEAEQLKVDLAELQSPERIVSEAQERLGLVKAPPPVYLQPQADDDARAAEVPPASPSTTVARAATPTTSVGAGTPTTSTGVASSKATSTPTSAAKATTPTTTGAGTGR